MVPGREVKDDSADIAQEPKPPRTKRIEHRTISSTFPVRLVSKKERAKHAKPRSIAIEEVDVATARRFWTHVSKGDPDACWPWVGAATTKGYGRFNWGGWLFSSHRLAYAIANGSVPQGTGYHGAVIMHTCDNPRCCNPSHLVCGTNQENAQDMAAKGRDRQSVMRKNAARSRVVQVAP